MNISLSFPVNYSTHTITQCFGENPEIYRQFIVAGQPLHGHNGIDFAVLAQERQDRALDHCSHPVSTAAPGQVIKIGFEIAGFGNYVKIRHNQFVTLYAHLSEIIVHLGQVISAYTLLGYTGSTGFSTGIHLHFGLYPDDEPKPNGFGGAIDPSPYFCEGEEYFPPGCLDSEDVIIPPSPGPDAMTGTTTKPNKWKPRIKARK